MKHLPRLPLLALAGLLALAVATGVVASAARMELPVIMVDLAHGQNPNGVCAMMSVVPDAYWVIVTSDAGALDECIKARAFKVIEGDLSAVADVKPDMLIIGQPTSEITDAEKEAILNWLGSEGHKALWCATDSDYPAQGGNLEAAQTFCNDLLDYLYENNITVHLRSDYVSVEDPSSNAGRPYRVVALVKPPARFDAELLALGAEKVLMHGPGAVAWVDDEGNWHKITDPGTPENIVPILVTTENGRIVEHQPRNPGEPGELGKAHTVGETGSFVLMAAEILNISNSRVVFIVSGESPYYGYQSLVTYQYHGVPLDGPRFFRNLVLWATGEYAELKAWKQLLSKAGEAYTKAEEALNKAEEAAAKAEQAASKAEEAASKADDAAAKAQEAMTKADAAAAKANEAISKAEDASGKAQDAITKADTAATKADDAAAKAEEAAQRAGSAYGVAIGAIVLSIIAIIAAGLAIQKATSRTK